MTGGIDDTMRITINLKKPKVNGVMEFNAPGIYVIKGPNGSGKTRVIKSIVFGYSQIDFVDKDFEKVFREKRYEMFSYMPQQIPQRTDCSAKEFIIKENENISISKFNDYSKRLNINQTHLNTKLNKLSGGEAEKCAFLSSVLKNTPVLFLDEPTNYLDDKSVKQVSTLLNIESKDRIIILVTHDKRLLNHITSINKVFLIENDGIVSDDTISDSKKKKPCSNPLKISNLQPYHFRIDDIVRKLFFSKGCILLIAVFASFTFLSLIINYNWFLSEYALRTIDKTHNSIVVYDVVDSVDTLNLQYAKGEHIRIDPSKYTTKALYQNLPEISQIQGVNKILLLDNHYIQSIIEPNKKNLDRILALPKDVYEVYDDQFEYCYEECLDLKSGRMPDDEKNEICISEKLAKELLGEKSEEYFIGKEVSINNTSYEIVGTQNGDYSFISYNDKANKGIKLYSKDNLSVLIADFGESSEEFHDEYIIITEPGAEKKVLDTLISEFPASNYRSYEFDKEWVKSTNMDFVIKKVIPFNIVIFIIVATLLLILSYFNFKKDLIIINDYNNYYFLGTEILKKRNNILFFTQVIMICVVSFCSLIWLLLQEERIALLSVISLTIINAIIALIPSMIFTYHKGKTYDFNI